MNVTQTTARLGASLSSADWMRARQAVSEPGRLNGAVTYPKAGQQYTGPVVFVTDTHVVQRVGRTSAVAHDLRLMRNGPEIGQAYEALKPGLAAPRLLVRYEGDRATAEPKPLQPAELAEVKRQAEAWAQKAITQPSTREQFMRQLEGFVGEHGNRARQDVFQGPAVRFARSLVAEQSSSAATPQEALQRIEARSSRFTDLQLELNPRDLSRGAAAEKANARQLHHHTPDPLVAATAILWARLDVADYRRLASDPDRRSAAVAMDNKSQRYLDALQTQAPQVAADVRHYQLREMQLMLAKEDRKREQLTDLAGRAAQGTRATAQREVQRGLER